MSNEKRQKMLWQELDESLIFPGITAENDKAVLEKMGKVMVQKGYAKETYVSALLNREEAFPTGLMIGKTGVAIPHTEVTHIRKEGIAIGVLKDPVLFGMMGTEGDRAFVSIVVMFTVKERGRHIEFLQKVLEMIQDEKFLKEIKKASDAKQMIEIVRKKEQGI